MTNSAKLFLRMHSLKSPPNRRQHTLFPEEKTEVPGGITGSKFPNKKKSYEGRATSARLPLDPTDVCFSTCLHSSGQDPFICPFSQIHKSTNPSSQIVICILIEARHVLDMPRNR